MKEYKVRVYDNGDIHWYLDNLRHREDGPAVVTSTFESYFLEGYHYTEEDFEYEMSKRTRDKMTK